MITPYRLGVHAPVGQEREATRLPVRGRLPEGLRGTFVRNSADPRHPPSERYHWFDGDGMVHAVHLADDGVSARNRWIRTAGFVAEEQAGRPLWSGINERPMPDSPGGPVKDTANTHLIVWQRQLLATWWLTGAPMAVELPSLATRGPGRTPTGAPLPRMAAHPKVDPRTGELVFLQYDAFRAPYLSFGVARPDGDVRVHALDVPHGHVPHDLAVTRRYTVLPDLPLGWGLDGGRRRITFFRDRPSRFGVVPRHGTAADVRWFEHDPCYVYHLVGAWEEGDDAIVVVGCRIADPIPAAPPRGDVPLLDTIELRPVMYRWRLDLRTGAVTGTPLDDEWTEFPRVDDRTWGTPVRHVFAPRIARGRPTLAFDGLVAYDLHTGGRARVDWPAGWTSGEVVFAPRPGGTEDDDGWLVTVRSSEDGARSELVVLDARTLGEEATVPLPWRVPHGFHAEWVPAGAV